MDESTGDKVFIYPFLHARDRYLYATTLETARCSNYTIHLRVWSGEGN